MQIHGDLKFRSRLPSHGKCAEKASSAHLPLKGTLLLPLAPPCSPRLHLWQKDILALHPNLELRPAPPPGPTHPSSPRGSDQARRCHPHDLLTANTPSCCPPLREALIQLAWALVQNVIKRKYRQEEEKNCSSDRLKPNTVTRQGHWLSPRNSGELLGRGETREGGREEWLWPGLAVLQSPAPSGGGRERAPSLLGTATLPVWGPWGPGTELAQ